MAESRSGLRRGPDTFALIIGGMKCGTTSLFELLVQHPQIAASRTKEPDFFASETDPAGKWDEYLGLWDWDPSLHRVALEASTAYTKYPLIKGVPERIARSPGESFKFIYIVRDPVRRIASQVKHGLYEGWGSSLDDGLTQDLIDFSKYAMQVDRYATLFPREDILLLTLEELRRSPDAVLHRTCRFLGVSPDHAFTGASEPRNTGDFYTIPPAVAAIARSRAARWAIDSLPREVRRRLRRWVGLSAGRVGDVPGRWQLNPDEVNHLRSVLAEDMARLRDWYGVRASWLGPEAE